MVAQVHRIILTSGLAKYFSIMQKRRMKLLGHATVYEAVNRIRTRGELPALTPGLAQDAMRQAIRRERRIELAFEDKRWWDLIRWNIAHINLNTQLHGIAITDEGGTLKYTTVPAVGGNRKFDASKNYLFPIPQDAIDQNGLLEQNPGY